MTKADDPWAGFGFASASVVGLVGQVCVSLIINLGIWTAILQKRSGMKWCSPL